MSTTVNTAPGPVQAPELSLKYMAWNVKEISGHLAYMKEIAMQIALLNGNLVKLLEKLDVKGDKIPF